MRSRERRPALSRRSTRLRGFDYASNAGYVITICSHDRKPLFGTIEDGRLLPSPIGTLVEREWSRTGAMRPGVLLDAFILMPNHLHGIVILQLPDDVGHRRRTDATVGVTCVHPDSAYARPFQAPSRGIEAIVRGFKAAVASAVRKQQPGTAIHVWQRGYHDRIIRDEAELERFRTYIVNNPRQWELDRYFGQGANGTAS